MHEVVNQSAMMNQNVLAFFGMPGWAEVLVIAFVGLLIFGKRLPDVARSLGKSVVEFKKGIRDVQDEVNTASKEPSRSLESKPPPTLESDAKSESEKAPSSADS